MWLGTKRAAGTPTLPGPARLLLSVPVNLCHASQWAFGMFSSLCPFIRVYVLCLSAPLLSLYLSVSIHSCPPLPFPVTPGCASAGSTSLPFAAESSCVSGWMRPTGVRSVAKRDSTAERGGDRPTIGRAPSSGPWTRASRRTLPEKKDENQTRNRPQQPSNQDAFTAF